ncbi:MAG: HAD-IIB family hydrolase [Spirulinaceae cyanobacterium]
MLIIFTDLDGTLLDSEDYSYAPALPMLEKLKQAKIPVIPVTSKTRIEVEDLLQELGIIDPFVVENGSGIFLPANDPRFQVKTNQKWGDYNLLRLGMSYGEARAGLKAVAEALGLNLQGFGDLSDDQLHQLTGLPPEAIKRAKAREFTEPFVTPKEVSSQRIEEAVKEQGFKVVVGDRFSHLIGAEAGKGLAVKKLESLYQKTVPNEKIITIGLGNSPNDIAMLENVDHPFIIPGHKGPHPGLLGRGWTVAPEAGPRGWHSVISEQLSSYNN